MPNKVLGIDVSDWQDPCDFTKVKEAGYSFVYAKCTEGNNYLAKTFADKRKQVLDAGLLFGAYHFMDWTQTAWSQIKFFLSAANYQQGDLMPMLDCEGNPPIPPRFVVAKMDSWLADAQAEIGRRCAIYMSPNFWSSSLGSTMIFNAYPLWLANYGVSSPPNLGEWKPMIWQYSSSVSVPGIPGDVDVDQFFGSIDDLNNLKGA